MAVVKDKGVVMLRSWNPNKKTFTYFMNGKYFKDIKFEIHSDGFDFDWDNFDKYSGYSTGYKNGYIFGNDIVETYKREQSVCDGKVKIIIKESDSKFFGKLDSEDFDGKRLYRVGLSLKLIGNIYEETP